MRTIKRKVTRTSVVVKLFLDGELTTQSLIVTGTPTEKKAITMAKKEFPEGIVLELVEMVSNELTYVMDQETFFAHAKIEKEDM